jgi:hypothetical protein
MAPTPMENAVEGYAKSSSHAHPPGACVNESQSNKENENPSFLCKIDWFLFVDN